MRGLEEKIRSEGSVLPGNILKVGSFLNQQIDAAFMLEMGREAAALFSDAGVTRVLTVEASGIAYALAVAAALDVPMVFAKKHNTANIGAETYSASVYSYTHRTEYQIVVSREYLCADDCVLLADDFLAAGNAMNGLIDIVHQAGARLAGCTAAIEKGFQRGGDALREKGIQVMSLAVIDAMDEKNGIVFREN